MAYLTDKERAELKRLVCSRKLQADARALREQQAKRNVSAGDFIRFVTGMNELMGHKRNIPRKIAEARFLL